MSARNEAQVIDLGESCAACGAWRGELGHEPHPDLFVAHLVEAFRHVRRVLRDDGILWVNLGDTYVTKPMGETSTHDPRAPEARNRRKGGANRSNRPADLGLKHKDKAGITARFPLAMQADGWYWRSEVPA